MNRKIDRTLPFVFAPTCKVVAINYPENPHHPGSLEFCGDYWEHLLTEFFTDERFKNFGIFVDTDNGMTAKAIEVSFDYNTPDEIIQDICEEAIRYMSCKVKPEFDFAQIVTLNSKNPELAPWNGEFLTVMGLDEDNDIDDNGFKYLLRDKNHVTISAYQHELEA